MGNLDIVEYFDKQIEFHTKLHSIAKEAMVEAYQDKSIESVQQWGNIMSQENTIVMTLLICKRALTKTEGGK